MHDPAEPADFSLRQWPDWSFWRGGAPARGRVLRERVTTAAACGAASLALLPWIVDIVRGHDGQGSVAVVAVVLYAAGFPLALWFGPTAPRRARVAIVAGMVLLGVAPAVALASPDGLTGMTYALTVGLVLLPLRHSVLLGLATAAGQAAWMRADGGAVNWAEVATPLGLTAVLGLIFALVFTVKHLQAARGQVRALAVARERERVARDLHDVLGHDIATLTVKVGLTRRILESGGDVEQAVAELHHVEELSRRALDDVRATVSGYREVTLAAELAGARVALLAAGVQADTPGSVRIVAPELHEVFGYVVREAVTNVLRHSGARRCRIRVGTNWVEVSDDGSGPPGDATRNGHGLVGLAERLAAVSARLEHGARPGGGFRVTARGPLPRPSAAEPAEPAAVAGSDSP